MNDQFWIFAAAFSLGLIFGTVLLAKTAEAITAKRIKAGYFDFNGKAYCIQEVSQ